MALVRWTVLIAVSVEMAAPGAEANAQARDTLQVSGLRSGPVCNAGAGEVGRAPSDSICPSRSVLMRGKDTCVYDSKEVPCTWWGFAFDYRNAVPSVPMVCIWERSVPSNEGNYQGVRSRNISIDTITIAFPADSGYLFHPGFDVVPRDLTVSWAAVQLTIACTYRERPLFTANYRMIFSRDFR